MSTPHNSPRIWAMRHGQSRANLEGVIVSQAGPLAFEWAGLTDRGRKQATDSARRTPLGPASVVVTSDFARARQTADLAAQVWGAARPVVDVRLRERDFGTFEGRSAKHYEEVWVADAAGVGLPDGVESVESVAQRVRLVIEEILSGAHHAFDEGQGIPASDFDVVLVAHGDVLQIAQASTRGIAPALHRSLQHLENAELRQLI